VKSIIANTKTKVSKERTSVARGKINTRHKGREFRGASDEIPEILISSDLVTRSNLGT